METLGNIKPMECSLFEVPSKGGIQSPLSATGQATPTCDQAAVVDLVERGGDIGRPVTTLVDGALVTTWPRPDPNSPPAPFDPTARPCLTCGSAIRWIDVRGVARCEGCEPPPSRVFVKRKEIVVDAPAVGKDGEGGDGGSPLVGPSVESSPWVPHHWEQISV